MATDNKQKVLIRSMSVEEIEKYMVNGDLNGKITPKNEDTWHQNYDFESFDGSYEFNNFIGSILSNLSKKDRLNLYVGRTSDYLGKLANFYVTKSDKICDTSRYIIHHFTYYDSRYIWAVPLFRPLIEYKE